MPPNVGIQHECLPGAAGDDDVDFLGAIGDRQQVVRAVPGQRAAGHPIVDCAEELRREPRRREARVLPEILLHFGARPAALGDRRRVLRAERQHRLALAQNVVTAGLPHRAGDGLQNAFGGVTAVVLDVMRSLAGPDGNGALLRLKAASGLKGRPGRSILALGGAEGELGRRALRRAIAAPGRRAGDVQLHQPHRAADRRVGRKGRTEAARAAVDARRPRGRPADQHEDRAGMCSGVDSIEVERRLGDRLNGGQHHGELLRAAARHHGVDRDDLHRRLPLARREDAEDLERIALNGVKHLKDAVGSGRNQRQPIGPPAPDALLRKRRRISRQRERFGRTAGL